MSAARSWKERTARAFLKKNSPALLLEVLSPRGQASFQQQMGKRRKKKELAAAASVLTGRSARGQQLQGDGPVELSPRAPAQYYSEPAQMVESFKAAEQEEVELMRTLRSRNVEKHRQAEVYSVSATSSAVSARHDVKYCMCGKMAFGAMIQCQLCRDWYHGK